MRLLVEEADLGPADTVLEVGPGVGNLTELLAARAGRVVAVEIDPDIAAVARARPGGRENVDLVVGDILADKRTIEPEVLAILEERRQTLGGPVKLVANLPYSAATPLVAELVVRDPPLERLVFTVQEEVALRFAAGPGHARLRAGERGHPGGGRGGDSASPVAERLLAAAAGLVVDGPRPAAGRRGGPAWPTWRSSAGRSRACSSTAASGPRAASRWPIPGRAPRPRHGPRAGGGRPRPRGPRRGVHGGRDHPAGEFRWRCRPGHAPAYLKSIYCGLAVRVSVTVPFATLAWTGLP